MFQVCSLQLVLAIRYCRTIASVPLEYGVVVARQHVHQGASLPYDLISRMSRWHAA